MRCSSGWQVTPERSGTVLEGTFRRQWEGDTLVIDTVGVNGKSWLPDGLPHTETLHVIERYRRTDFAHLVIDITFEDPGCVEQAMESAWHLDSRSTRGTHRVRVHGK